MRLFFPFNSAAAELFGSIFRFLKLAFLTQLPASNISAYGKWMSGKYNDLIT